MTGRKRPTMDEVRAWPATVSVEDASLAIGISKAYGYELISQGRFPCQVLPLGPKRYQVLQAGLVRLLDGREEADAEQPEALSA